MDFVEPTEAGPFLDRSKTDTGKPIPVTRSGSL